MTAGEERPFTGAQLEALAAQLAEACARPEELREKQVGSSLRVLEPDDLVPPERIIEVLGMGRQSAKRDIFGMGGNENVEPRFVRNRCTMRLSISVYKNLLGVPFTGEMYDYLESLTGMDEGDAREWYARLGG